MNPFTSKKNGVNSNMCSSDDSDTSETKNTFSNEKDAYFKDMLLKEHPSKSSSSMSSQYRSSGSSIKVNKFNFDAVSKLSQSLSSMDLDDEDLYVPPVTRLQAAKTIKSKEVTLLKDTKKKAALNKAVVYSQSNEGNAVTPISSARYHQGDEKFGAYAGVQCMILASTAAVYSVIKNRVPFDTAEMDCILSDGTTTYASFLNDERLAGRNSNPRTLFAHEVPTKLKVGNYNINLLEPEWVHNGLFPINALGLNKHITQLVTILNSLFNNAHFNPTKDGYIFTFQSYTVSFWKDDNMFYLFNSHAVGLNGTFDSNTPEFNRARLFQVRDVHTLAKLLLIDGRHNIENNQYEINKISIVNFEEIQPALIHNTKSNSLNDCLIVTSPTDMISTATQKKHQRPRKVNSVDDCIITITSTTDEVSTSAPKKRGRPRKIKINNNDDSCDTASTTSTLTSTSTTGQKKRGRPCKVKRGRKKQTTNSLAEAQTKYVLNKPEALSKAKQTYKQNNPDLVKEKNLQYKKENAKEIKQQNQQYYKKRSIPSELRNVGLIAQLSGNDLNKVQQHSLEKPSLLSDDIFKCPKCGTKLFNEEMTRKEWCCGQGRFNVSQLPPLTESFYEDYVFIKKARTYNNLFAFSALQTTGSAEPIRDGYLNFIKIQGRTYHKIYDLSCTSMNNNLNYYVYDENERYARGNQLNLNKEIMIEITHFLHQVNPYIDHFKRLSLEPSDEAFLSFQYTNRTTDGPNLGSRVTNTEVAAIISCDETEIQPRAITVWKIGNAASHTIPILNKLYEPLHYTILYPHGNTGWFLNMLQNPTTSNNDTTPPPKLTLLRYCRNLFLSDWRFSEIGRLSEEWQVDMICRIIEDRLNYIKSTQGVFRTAPLNELVDVEAQQIHRDLITDETIVAESGAPIPGRIYLPNTFTGGPRYMATKYFDAIALVNRLGRPSYFLTFTCNPSWPEIAQSRKSTSYTSTLLVTRVFKLKLAQLIKDLNSGQYLGEIDYYMYVIEYQKRGLPHAHICFRVKGGGPIQNADIDKVIRADIPSEAEADGRIRKLVLKHMIHGPCDQQNYDLPCYNAEKNQCERYFPKLATDITYIDNRGFVVLKRNPNNAAIIRNKRNNQNISVNDLWVIPYNAALLLKYNCHMNLEISSTRKVVKYLFKYITKGPDLARVAVVNTAPTPASDNLPNNNDNQAPPPTDAADPIAPQQEQVNEVEEYVTKRYIGSCEAAWRLLSFELTERVPFVRQLPVHLEGQQSVLFKKDILPDPENTTSLLLTYFRRPLDSEFNNITYMTFYEQYMVHSKKPSTRAHVYECTDGKHFVTARTCRAVTRMYWATPKRGELYYLRMMLEFFPCRSYTDLYALGGSDCTTFQQAARNMGIADDEQEYERALQEASGFYTGRKLRHFFVLLITNGAPASILWDHHKESLSEDYIERLQDKERAFYQALCEIDRLLRKHGSCVSDHGLPQIHDDTTELGRERLEFVSEELRLTEFVEEWLPRLCLEQKDVFEHVRTLLHNDNYKRHDSKPCIFIQGCSGSGKTLLLNLIAAYVRGPLKKVAICTATSGIAALNYENGITAHSMFKLPIELRGDDTGVWGISNSTQRAELIREAAVIIYDEAPMAHKHLIHLIDRSLQDLMNSTRMFGGKIFILAGDFRQIPPVVPSARCSNDIVRASMLTSPLWQSIHKFSLVQAQRTRSDNDYSDFLLKLGSGLLETFSFGNAVNLICLNNINTCDFLEELIQFVFQDDILSTNPDECAARAILTMHNVNVRNINRTILNRVLGDELTCFSADSVEPELAQEFHLSTSTLNQVQSNSAPDHELKIKIGCVCMIIRNLSFVDRLVNGSKVIVTGVTPRIITVRKPNSQEIYPIPRIAFRIPIEAGSPIDMIRYQFPLQVSYAMTVHKSQGQTIDRVGVDLRSDVFAHGQLYVALGRVRTRDNILVLINRHRIYNDIPYTTNVIIKQLLI